MLKDRDRTRQKRLNRLGIIRLGYRRASSKGSMYPVQADHFVLDDAQDLIRVFGPTLCDVCRNDQRRSVAIAEGTDADGNRVRVCEKHYKQARNPVDIPVTGREISVLLPFPDIERNFNAHYMVWAGGVLICKGDGEHVITANPFVVQSRKDGGISVRNASGHTLIDGGVTLRDFQWGDERFSPGDIVPCPGAAQDAYPHCQACRPSAILKVMVVHPQLQPRFGYYQIATGSGRNYDTILGTLGLVYNLAGRVNSIPFTLRLVEEGTVFQDADGKRRASTRWFLQLEPDMAFINAMYAKSRAALISQPGGGQDFAALPAPEDQETPVEDADYYYAEPDAPPPYAEVQEEEVAVAEQVPTDRPYTPDTLKEKLATFESHYQGKKASEAQINLVKFVLPRCFDTDGDKRAAAVKAYLFGDKDNLTSAQVLAALRWLTPWKPEENGSYEPDPVATQEAALVWRAAMVAEGQTSFI